MKKIIISPRSRLLRNGKINPKNFPWWKEVVTALQQDDIYVIQIGETRQNEEQIGANEIVLDLSLNELKNKIEECDAWASVDNFLHHLCSFTSKRGVVIFSLSDPLIFGYPKDINLLKDRKYLRTDQFGIWESAEYNEKAFPPVDIVVNAIKALIECKI
jgi:ADP-heptose:LPS heptosyltransferase